jgi:hypothetical protein
MCGNVSTCVSPRHGRMRSPRHRGMHAVAPRRCRTPRDVFEPFGAQSPSSPSRFTDADAVPLPPPTSTLQVLRAVQARLHLPPLQQPGRGALHEARCSHDRDDRQGRAQYPHFTHSRGFTRGCARPGALVLRWMHAVFAAVLFNHEAAPADPLGLTYQGADTTLASRSLRAPSPPNPSPSPSPSLTQSSSPCPHTRSSRTPRSLPASTSSRMSRPSCR